MSLVEPFLSGHKFLTNRFAENFLQSIRKSDMYSLSM
jgi:hypothetical protein